MHQANSQQKTHTQAIKAEARRLGFDLVGIASANPHEHVPFFNEWLAKGNAATMEYLQRRREDRADPQQVLAGARTLICCGLNYHNATSSSQEVETPERAWISSYAWGDDYHEVFLSKLQELETFIQKEISADAALKSYVDTGPILERSYAASAGLGWIGKNTMLINRKLGSFFFIGEILTDLSLELDTMESDHCGKCRLCIDACPTEALTPYQMDANHCIAYLTIEHRGDIPSEFHDKLGHHVVGCDICQEVCPWNQQAPLASEAAFQARPGLYHPTLDSLEALDEEAFRSKFKKSAIKRVKWEGLKRNLDIVRRNNERK